MKKNTSLDYNEIITTIERLEKRISDRFPDSSLKNVIIDFREIAKSSKKNVEWISKPNLLLRFFSYFVIVIASFGIIYSISQIKFSNDIKTVSNIITTSEAFVNEIVLIGAAIFFMVTIETRVKRRRTSKYLNQLREIAHVIDMHQLTKDPGMHLEADQKTENSPERELSLFELHRYLDYCSEAFSLIGKVAVLYAQSLPHEVVVRNVNEIEELSSGLSRKVWQKLIILNEIEGRLEKKELKETKSRKKKKI